MSHGTFLHADNLQNTSQLIGLYGIFSIGAGIVIITGGIDLSVGSLFALFGVLLSMMLTLWHWPWPLAVLAILGGGALIGVFHGFLITRVGLQPFIVTLVRPAVLPGHRPLHRRRRHDGLRKRQRL